MKVLRDVISVCLISLFSLLLISCSDSNTNSSSVDASQPPETLSTPPNVDESPAYDSSRWKTIIPESCQHFSDGCNTCTRAPGSFEAACTRKACFQYEEPECLDEDAASTSSTDTLVPGNSAGDGYPSDDAMPNIVTFVCDKAMTFSVVRDMYIADDQRFKLQQDQIMFRDAQSHTATLLNRVETASGERYQGDELDFWTKGNEAMVNQDGEELYTHCVVS